jgi:hypothetical protein
MTGARIIGILMGAEEKHAPIPVEDVLGTVAMVNVEVHDENPVHVMVRLGRSSCDGHVVVKTEAHSAIGGCVVSWGTNQGKSIASPALKHGSNDVV